MIIVCLFSLLYKDKLENISDKNIKPQIWLVKLTFVFSTLALALLHCGFLCKYQELLFYPGQAWPPHHHSLGAALMFCEKAERRAWWWWGRRGEGADGGDWAELELGGVRKFAGWEKLRGLRGLKGNWWGRARPARGECESSASCLEAKAEYPRLSRINIGIPSLRGLKPGPNPSNPFSCIAFLVLYRWFWNQILT